MNKNKGFIGIGLIIVIVLGIVVVGGGAYYLGKSGNKMEVKIPETILQSNESQNSPEVENDASKKTQNTILNNSVVSEWKSLSSDALIKIANKENIGLIPEDGITTRTTVDITGDGLDEGIFGGNGGNNGMSFVMVKDTDGINFVAKQKNKDGTIQAVWLLSVGRVMVNEQYELLPSEHGFYTVSRSYDQITDKFKCNTNGGVNAYSWNSLTKLFEWNQALTTKYTAQVCK